MPPSDADQSNQQQPKSKPATVILAFHPLQRRAVALIADRTIISEAEVAAFGTLASRVFIALRLRTLRFLIENQRSTS